MNTIIVLSHFDKNQPNKYVDYTHSHAKEYIKRGYRVYAFAPFPVLPIQNFFKSTIKLVVDGVQVICLKRLSVSNLFVKSRFFVNGWLYYLGIKKYINNILKEEDVEFIDAHTFNAESYAAYQIKKKYPKLKVFITFHGSDLEQAINTKNGIRRLKKYAKIIDYYICVSDKLSNKLERIGITNVKVIYNGILMPKIKNIPKEKVFISVGNLVKSKNFPLIIDSFAKFCKKNSNYILKIIGDGYLKDSLKQSIVDLGLENKILFLGRMKNIEVFNELSKAYAFILVSSPEGFGIVYPEAMYCGCITIGTKNEGIDGFIKNGVNGFLVDPNLEDVVKIMEYAISNDCSEIIKQGIEDAKKLTWEENCQKYLELK